MVVKIDKEREESNKLKQFWKWLWDSESWLSYLVFLIIVFIFVKFIFLPGLGMIFGTALPLAIVESSSMDHHVLDETGVNDICGTVFDKTGFLNSDEYWNTCGSWYEGNTNITKAEFQNFIFKNGFSKGDLIIIFGKKANELKIGDVIIFNAGRANPIIHRVISLNPIQTKGDHNPGQLNEEKTINLNQVVGVAVAKIPYVGWVKLIFFEIGKKFSS